MKKKKDNDLTEVLSARMRSRIDKHIKKEFDEFIKTFGLDKHVGITHARLEKEWKSWVSKCISADDITRLRVEWQEGGFSNSTAQEAYAFGIETGQRLACDALIDFWVQKGTGNPAKKKERKAA